MRSIFKVLLRDQRRNQLALAGVGVESPAMVRAFDLFAVELSAGKRHAAMRTGVAQGKGLALPVASDYQGLFKQHRFHQLSAVQLSGRKRAIPETETA
jgi:hypothetical protein